MQIPACASPASQPHLYEPMGPLDICQSKEPDWQHLQHHSQIAWCGVSQLVMQDNLFDIQPVRPVMDHSEGAILLFDCSQRRNCLLRQSRLRLHNGHLFDCSQRCFLKLLLPCFRTTVFIVLNTPTSKNLLPLHSTNKN